jgi:hypothetical protein
MFNRWDLTDRERWESARALGRGKWVLRESALTVGLSLTTIWPMSAPAVSRTLFWWFVAGIACADLITLYILYTVYGEAQRRHEGSSGE